MESESYLGVSVASKGILHYFKNALAKKQMTLHNLIYYLFKFDKVIFSRSEFLQLIVHCDPHRKYDSIDLLFEELDENKNNRVEVEKLKAILNLISEEDNPRLRSQLMKSRIFSIEDQMDEEFVLSEVADMLMREEYILTVISNFDVEGEGYLRKDDVQELLRNFGYYNQRKRKLFMEAIFKDIGRISIDNFVAKLKLQDEATRVQLSIKTTESRLMDIKMSQFNMDDYISQHSVLHSLKSEQQYPEQRRLDEEQNMLMSENNSKRYRIDKITQELKAYFNYGSELAKDFADFAIQVFKKNFIYIDKYTPSCSKAVRMVHLLEIPGMADYQIYQMAESMLERNRTGAGLNFEPKSVKQGRIGDCYFLSAAAGVVEIYPELIYRLFVFEKNHLHFFGAKLFIDGCWRTIALDARFPLDINGNFCGAQSRKGQIWVMLLEKAWAKVFGSYDAIHSGCNFQGLNALTGAASIQLQTTDPNFLKHMTLQLKKGSIITCGTSTLVAQMTTQQQDHLGIYSDHAYTIHAVEELPSTKGTIILVKLRNPWGKRSWRGDWSFESPKWKKEYRDRLNYKKDQYDGSFYMCLSDFKRYYTSLDVCQMNVSYRNSFIEIDTDRDSFNYVSFVVEKRGNYFFTIYQENDKKYKHSPGYHKSKSWLFLARLRNDRIEAISSKAQIQRDCTIECILQPGEYLLMSKVAWNFWERHPFNLASYGPQELRFKLSTRDNTHSLQQFINSKETQGLGEKTYYNKVKVQKHVYFNLNEGYGFISIQNQDQIIFKSKIQFVKFVGILLLPPHTLPLTFELCPEDKAIAKFLLDPQRFQYSLSETITIIHLKK